MRGQLVIGWARKTEGLVALSPGKFFPPEPARRGNASEGKVVSRLRERCFSPGADAETGFGKPPRDRAPHSKPVEDVRWFAGADPTARSAEKRWSDPRAGVKKRAAPACAARAGKPLPKKSRNEDFPTPFSPPCPPTWREADPTTAPRSDCGAATRSKRRSRRCGRNRPAGPGPNKMPAGRAGVRRWFRQARCPAAGCGGSAYPTFRSGGSPAP